MKGDLESGIFEYRKVEGVETLEIIREKSNIIGMPIEGAFIIIVKYESSKGQHVGGSEYTRFYGLYRNGNFNIFEFTTQFTNIIGLIEPPTFKTQQSDFEKKLKDAYNIIQDPEVLEVLEKKSQEKDKPS